VSPDLLERHRRPLERRRDLPRRELHEPGCARAGARVVARPLGGGRHAGRRGVASGHRRSRLARLREDKHRRAEHTAPGGAQHAEHGAHAWPREPRPGLWDTIFRRGVGTIPDNYILGT